MTSGATDAGENVGVMECGGNGEESAQDGGGAFAYRRRGEANLNLKVDDSDTGENGSVWSAENSFRPTSVTLAWGRILIVPSPTLSHMPHSPRPEAWGIPADAVEPPHELSEWSVGWRRPSHEVGASL